MKLSVPSVLGISPFRLNPEYRDDWGEPVSKLAAMVDQILERGCYVPRWYHAPDNEAELEGVATYLEYALAIPAGSWILGFAHSTLGNFVCQITDMALNFRLFDQPMPDAFFQNIGATGLRPVRLLTAPYPVTPPGQIKVEFWNQLPGTTNTAVQLSLLVAEPDPQFQE